eukprot:PLAT4650.1.p1 GENE.PLAT4650.1~~PLAT4650.1.p1  ORF type:complete len:356 (-),score=137.37 PLAT4650.1:218-1246(-)
MKSATVALLLCAAAVAGSASLDSQMCCEEDLIAKVNSGNATWTAGVNERFAGRPLSFAASQCGALLDGRGPKLPLREAHGEELIASLPADFDAIEKWPACQSIHDVRDQSACGSCWAFGASESATDRYCIGVNGSSNPRLSAEDVLSCCYECGNGCGGGYPSAAWQYMTQTGVVTGYTYDNTTWCSPYTLPPCMHHVQGPLKPCPSSEYNTPSCPNACASDSKWPTPWKSDKHVFATSYSVDSDVSQIQAEIYKHGSVEGTFTVYSDFLTYKSGVYQHTTGQALGGHAIKIIGWGTENGTPYWKVVNSWNAYWGNHGFFNILRGQNECGIESGIVSGLWKKQ